MKKFFKILGIIIVITLVCLVIRLGILDFLNVYDITEEEKVKFNDCYYYNKLTNEQKEMYIKMDRGVSNLSKTIVFGFNEKEDINKDLEMVIEAYYNDHPEYFYLPYNYKFSNINLVVKNLTVLNLDYLVADEIELLKMNNEIDIAIREIISNNITSDMTDYEKEVAIHDALVKKVAYYKYEDIDKIPNVKHTIYGALVENEAVCDGYSKAFMVILKRLNIDSIIVSGMLDNVNHAWNIVDINGEYYHVDVTSDSMDVDGAREVVHTYFNLTDSEISKSHEISNMFSTPKCNSTKYNYYIQEGLYIDSRGNLNFKLEKIIEKQKSKKVLEVRYNKEYSSQDLINELYNLDFNLWKTKRYTNVEYFNVNDVYFFKK